MRSFSTLTYPPPAYCSSALTTSRRFSSLFRITAWSLCFSCLHALIRLLFVSFFSLSGHSSVGSSSSLTRFLLLVFLFLYGFFIRDILLPRAYYIIFSRGLIFSLVAPTFFLAALLVCFSLEVLLYFASPSHWLFSYAVHYTMHCCACRSPLLVAYCLLPSFGFGCSCYLLTSPSLFTCAVYKGSFCRRSSSLGVVRASALAFSLYVSFCLPGASLLYGYPGILAKVFSTIILSRFPLSRQFTSALSAVRLMATYLSFRILLHLFRCALAFA